MLARGAQGAVVGVQRRRRSAELLRARGNDARAFAERLARRPEVIAAANVFDDRGQALLAIPVEREWPSDLLPLVQEIEALPAEAVASGQRFRGTHPMGLEFRAEGWEDIGGEASFHLRGSLPRDQVVLDLWFGTESRILQRLELRWVLSGLRRGEREKLRLDLVERHRGERPDDWLGAPERRQAVLAAMLIADGLPVEQARLEALLAVEDPIVQRAALRLLWRRKLPVTAGAVAPLAEAPIPTCVLSRRSRFGGPPPPKRGLFPSRAFRRSQPRCVAATPSPTGDARRIHRGPRRCSTSRGSRPTHRARGCARCRPSGGAVIPTSSWCPTSTGEMRPRPFSSI